MPVESVFYFTQSGEAAAGPERPVDAFVNYSRVHFDVFIPVLRGLAVDVRFQS